MDATSFGPIDDHVTAVLQRIEQEEERLRHDRETLGERLLRLQRDRATTSAPADDTTLREFLAKPYVIRPLGGDQYELIVPKFTGFRGGWSLRTDGAFNVYLVTRFIHLINPLPEWLAKDLGYQKAAYSATLDGNALVIKRGDVKAVAAKLGKGVARVEGNRIHLKPASRFDIIRRIIREDGILPYAPAPIPADLRRDATKHIARDEKGELLFTLRPHQARDYARFLELGAVAFFAYGQTGKSYEFLQACAGLKGKKILFVPTRALRDQWLIRLQMLTPEAQAEVTVATYHSLAKYRDTEWTLAAYDESHHLPADLFIEAATLRTVARMGLSATPVREDGNEDLIPALCGFPLGADWPVSETQRPRVFVHNDLKDENAKLARLEQLLEREIEGKTLVFTWRLDVGERAAKRLSVPFIHGGTKKPLSIIEANDTVVISKIGDAGLSFPVDRIVEIDFQYGSRQEAGQHLLRAAYDTGRQAEYHILMTRQEFESYSKRLLIYEQWGFDVQIIEAEGRTAMSHRSSAPRNMVRIVSAPRRPSRERAAAPTADETSDEPADTAAAIMALPTIHAKLADAAKDLGVRTIPYLRMAFRLYHKANDAGVSPRDIADARGIQDAATRSRISSACKALKKAGLLLDAGQGRYQINQDEIGRAVALSKLVR